MIYLIILLCLVLLVGCQQEEPFIYNGEFSDMSIVHQSQPEDTGIVWSLSELPETIWTTNWDYSEITIHKKFINKLEIIDTDTYLYIKLRKTGSIR